FTLVPSMSAAENLVMSRADVPRIIDWKSERARLDAFLQQMPFRVPLDVPVGALATGERQKTEILKQLYLDRRLLVLDEPTSTLTPQEAEEVLGLIRSLTGRGDITTVLITHKLKEVAAFADDVTVLRKGRVAGSGSARELGPAELTALMIGELHVPPSETGRAVTQWLGRCQYGPRQSQHATVHSRQARRPPQLARRCRHNLLSAPRDLRLPRQGLGGSGADRGAIGGQRPAPEPRARA